MDFAEALTNATIGLCVSWALTVFALGYTPAQGMAVTAMFFVASTARAWAIRKLFRRLGK